MSVAQEKRMKELVEVVNKYRIHYHVYDKPLVSDKEYDKLFYELVDLETELGITLPNSPTTRVGADPLDKFEKVKHLQKLYSLDKAQSISEIEEWVERNRKIHKYTEEYSMEYKFDGLAMAIIYEDGKFKQAITRGNGEVGEDVTEQVRTIETVPMLVNYSGKMEIQGEAIMRLSVLEKYNKKTNEPLKNARNGAAGAIRNLDPKETASRHLDFFAYNVNYIDGKNFKTQQEINTFLRDNGFYVINYFHLSKTIIDIEQEIERINKEKKTYDFLIDGIVIKINNVQDRRELGFTNRFPRGMIAYKFDPEETSTILNSVTWQVGRTGKITPVAELEAVEIAGVTVERATLNNPKDIERKKLKLLSRVFVRRSNEVIPEIMGVAEDYEYSKDIEIPKECPCCGSALTFNDKNLFCPNHDGCMDQIVARISHFASKSGMDIVGVSGKTVTQMHKVLGVTNVDELYRLTRQDLEKLEGFKEKKIENFLESIEKSKTPELANFIYAMGIDGIGKKMSIDLAKKFGNFDNLKNVKIEELTAMDDIAEITAKNIFDFVNSENNMKIIQNLINFGIKIKEKTTFSDLPLKNEKIVLTGVLEKWTRSEATKILEDLGAEVLNSVSKKTTILVFGHDAGSKLVKAKQLGIRIIDENQFENLIAK